MQHGERLWAGIFVFIPFVVTLGVISSTGLASDTNVFVVKNTLQAGAPTQSGVKLLKFKSGADPLLGTNATSTAMKLAVAVMDTDCLPGGLDPKVELVVFNRNTSKIVATLVEFTTIAPIFVGDNEIVIQATGEGRSGVEAANLDALITFGYEPCASTRNPGDPTSVEIAPLGFIRPTGAPGFNAPILPDSGSVEIVSDDPDTPELSVALDGRGTAQTSACNIDLNPQSISFGNVGLGSNATQNLTIRNNGESPCTVSGITLNGSTAFSFSNSPPFTVLPGGSVVVSVSFAPSIVGADSAVLRVTSTDPNDPQQFIDLAGTGVVLPSPCALSIRSEEHTSEL